MKRRNLGPRSALLGVVAGLLVPLGFGSVATATDQNGVAENGEFVFYYNSNQKGGISDLANSVTNLAHYAYTGAGQHVPGFGSIVKNNSASVSNRHKTKTVRVYYNSNYQGVYDSVAPNSSRNLSKTYNQNASFRFLS